MGSVGRLTITLFRENLVSAFHKQYITPECSGLDSVHSAGEKRNIKVALWSH